MSANLQDRNYKFRLLQSAVHWSLYWAWSLAARQAVELRVHRPNWAKPLPPLNGSAAEG